MLRFWVSNGNFVVIICVCWCALVFFFHVMAIISEGQQSVETKSSSGKSLKVKLKAGASIVKIKPLFTHDSKFIIVASHCNLKVFNVSSGDCFKTLEGHTSPIVSIQEYKKNQLQVLSCSEDGTVIRWDYTSGTAVKACNLRIKTKVSAFYAPLVESSWFACTKIENTDCHRLYCIAVAGSKILKKTLAMKPVHPHSKTVGFGIGGKFVAAVYGNALHMYNNIAKTYKSHMTGERELTCVACHPSEYLVATGDDTGRVLVWANMLTSNHPTRSVYHWHTLPVADLAFSAEGSYIYSGGGESVLVKWNLNSENKRVLPRLGLPIYLVTASQDNSLVATSHIDNAVQIISAQNQVVQIIQGFALGHLHGVEGNIVAPTGLLYDPRTSSIVTNGRPGHLQFYKIHEDKQLFNLDIVGRNIMSQERNTVVINPDVDKAALDHRGTWLATVESRDDGETMPEIRLKFWNFELTTQKFTLNTSVFLPHYKKINCIKFRPPTIKQKSCDLPMAVTTSDDKHFKLWVLNKVKDGDKDVSNWACESMGYYRDMYPGDASFSEDGSLLAVAFGHVATLWMPDTTTLNASLSQAKSQNDIKQLIFGRNKCKNLLVCHSGSLLTVWNVLTLKVVWSINCDIQYVAGDLNSDVMVAFTKDKNMFVFRPSEPKPVASFRNVSETPIVSAIFVPKCHHLVPDCDHTSEDIWLQNSEIYFLNENQQLKTVSKEHEESDLNSKVEEGGPVKTIFSLLQAEHKKSEAKLEIDQVMETEKTYKDMLENKGYQDPTILCRMLLTSLLLRTEESQKKEPVKEENHLARSRSSDSSSDDDELSAAKTVKTTIHRACDVLPSEGIGMDTEDSHSNENVIEDFGFLRKFLTT